jgi:hypothetical protein
LMPTPILQAGFQDVTVTTHPDLGYRGFPATNNFFKICT